MVVRAPDLLQVDCDSRHTVLKADKTQEKTLEELWPNKVRNSLNDIQWRGSSSKRQGNDSKDFEHNSAGA